MHPRYYIARVTDNKDPDKLNRVQVCYLDEEEYASDWIPVITPFAGNDSGLTMIPDIDDQVIILSMDQYNSHKVVIGSTWHESSQPPATNENSSADFNDDGKNSLHFIKSRSGNMVILDDSEGEEKIQLISSDGKSRFEFSVKDKLVSLITESDLTLNAKGLLSFTAEEVKFTAKKKMSLSAEEIEIAAKKKMDITASQDITVKGSGIALN